MTHKDQQLINEAYVKVMEAAPQTLGSRIGQGLKGWALSKVNKGILSPFFAASQERLEADKETSAAINKQKAQFEAAFKQRFSKKYSDASGSPKQFVINYLRINPKDPRFAQYLRSNIISDRNINEILKKAYTPVYNLPKTPKRKVKPSKV